MMRYLFGVVLFCGCAWAVEVQPEVKMKSDADGNVRVTVIVPASYLKPGNDKDGKPLVLTPAELKAKVLQNVQAFVQTSLQVMERTSKEINDERDAKKAAIDAAYSAAVGLAPKDE